MPWGGNFCLFFFCLVLPKKRLWCIYAGNLIVVKTSNYSGIYVNRRRNLKRVIDKGMIGITSLIGMERTNL